MSRSELRWAGMAALLLCARQGAAQVAVPGEEPTDVYALPDAPAPPTLPDLTHRGLAASLENTVASILSTSSAGVPSSRSFGWAERLEGEQALSNRRWYAGVAEQLALGSASDGGFRVVPGNPEVWGRALWASQAGLAYGGGLGAVLPAVPHGSSTAPVARTIGVVRPWDYAVFLSDDFILRPFFDVRAIDGRVILQLRQGIDWEQSSGSLTSRTTLYIGYRPIELLGIGFEAWEVYLIQAPQRKDDGRAAYAVSPSIRLMTRELQPTVSFLLPIDRPLFDSVENFWALRLSMSIVFEPSSVTR